MSTWTIGVNVPWTVAWTGEQSFELQPSVHFPGLSDLVQVQRPGQGTPMFAAQHVTRHRMGIADHRCHVCGELTSKRDRFIFPVQSGGFVLRGDDTERYAGNVPPVHLACGKRARLLCPHLNHTLAHALPYPSEPTRLMRRTDVVPGMEALAKGLPPGLKVVFTCYRLFGPRFTRHVKRLREEHAARTGEAVVCGWQAADNTDPMRNA
jgi:hypothetical protein